MYCLPVTLRTPPALIPRQRRSWHTCGCLSGEMNRVTLLRVTRRTPLWLSPRFTFFPPPLLFPLHCARTLACPERLSIRVGSRTKSRLLVNIYTTSRVNSVFFPSLRSRLLLNAPFMSRDCVAFGTFCHTSTASVVQWIFQVRSARAASDAKRARGKRFCQLQSRL